MLLAIALATAPAPLVAQAPPSIESLSNQAQTAQQRGDLAGAIAAYRKLIKLAPRTAAAYNNLGSLLYDAGDYRGAIATTEAGLLLDRSMASSYAVLGQAYLAVGQPVKAAAALRTAIAKNGKDERSADALVRALLDANEDPAAATLLQQRVERNPNDQSAWRELGDVYLRMSQNAHSKVLAIDPQSPIALDLQGEIQEGMGHYQAAQGKYQEALQAAPDKPGVHEHLGNIFWVQAEWKKAEEQFRAELAIDPLNCRAAWKLGDSLLQERVDTAGALATLERSLERCPSLMPARVDRAQALIELNRAPEAADDLKLAERDDPTEPQIHFLLARVYRAEGKPDQAKTESDLFASLVAKKSDPGNATQPQN